MFSKHKWPTFEGIFVIIIMVISIFSFVYSVYRKLNMLKKIIFNFFIAFFTEDKITGAGFTDVTGKMVKVTGMDFKKLKSVKNNA